MTRSKYLKRQFKLKTFKKILLLWMKEWLFNTTVAVVLAVTVLLIWRAFNPPAPFSAEGEAVAAMRVPAQAMSNLFSLAEWFDLPFDQLLAMYAVANDFFPHGSAPAVELDILKDRYVAGFRRLRRQYSARDIRPYFEMFNNLIAELELFPLPPGYGYMFSDTWDRASFGTNILDQENIRGRIPVLSMTEGNIRQAGWHYNLGYHVIVETQRGSRILYAQLDSINEGITAGHPVYPGQNLGTMGSSGERIPVNLHIAISPKVAFAEDFWINPYPFLRHMEEKMYIFPPLDHTNYRREEPFTL